MIFTITSIGDESVESWKLLHQLSGGLGCQRGGDDVLWTRGGNNAAFEAPWVDGDVSVEAQKNGMIQPRSSPRRHRFVGVHTQGP
jgi:hypothetical protein